METCSVLLVSSETGALRAVGTSASIFPRQWTVTIEGSTPTAFRTFQKSLFDVVVVDPEFGDSTGVEFLNTVARNRPEVIRFLCTENCDQALLDDCVRFSHRLFTSVPTDEAMREAIEEAVATKVWLLRYHHALQDLVSRMRVFPSPPTLYFKVLAELKSTKASIARLVELIEADLAVTTRIIKVVNLVNYGQQKPVTNLGEAINILGFETIKSLVLAIQAVVRIDEIASPHLSADQIWRHAVAVANRAWRIAMLQTGDVALADDAFTAGLLHDLGKLVYASNFPDEYGIAFDRAVKEQRLLIEVEKEILGVTHAEAGAYLAALWGLPRRIVEAIGWHHSPSASKDEVFTPLTAVHAANVFEHEAEVEAGTMGTAELAVDYLNRIGLSGATESWRDASHGTGTERSRRVANPKVPRRGPAGSRADGGGILLIVRNNLRLVAASILLSAGVWFSLHSGWVKTILPGRDGDDGTGAAPGGRGRAGQSGLLRVNARSLPAPADTAPLPLAEPDLKVTDILIRGGHSVALINGIAVRTGDTMFGVKILEINTKTVRVQKATGELTLSLP